MTIEPAQRTAARLAGAVYLAVLVNSLASEFFLRAPLLMASDAPKTARNVLASEHLFRASIVTNLLTVAGNIVLIVALYVVLRPINTYVALLAAFFRVVESAVFATTAFNDFVARRLLSGAEYLQPIATEQLQALARMFLSMRHSGGLVGSVFMGLGSATFAYLWFRSRYIPRGLAAWGVFASLTLAIGILVMLIWPELTGMMGPAYWAPIFLFDLILGIWLLARGIRAGVGT